MMNFDCTSRTARHAFRQRSFAIVVLIASLLPVPLFAKVVVFWQPEFPTVASQPVERTALAKALDGMDPRFVDLGGLKDTGALSGIDLLVLPHGSAFPADAWKAIKQYLDDGGNLLILGGQPLRVPVTEVNGKFVAARPQDTYARVLDFRHTYKVPVPADVQFAWRHGYDFPPTPHVRARRYFAVEGRLNGLGYMVDATGLLVAAPVIVADYSFGLMLGSRVVALDFDPEPGYWQSEDGVSLIHQTAIYASKGATAFSVETLFSTIRPGEPPQITVHLRSAHQQRSGGSMNGEVKVTLKSESETVDTSTLPIVTKEGAADIVVPFQKALPSGFYTVSAVLSDGGQFREFYQNGFWVGEAKTLESGPVLGVHGDFLTRDGAPFFPVGTNYFTTEENGWDFSGPRNAWVWDKDFDEMASHGVSFVRTGVWMPNGRFIEPNTGGVNERFLRNLEAFLRCAQRHKIAVNFTFFAFSPRSGGPGRDDPDAPLPNPYTDPSSIRAQQAYVGSVVEQFKDVPWLSWDLINEPSFSNPRHIFKGNYPNGDPTEIAAWQRWLRQKYNNIAALADAWAVSPEQLGSFDSVPLPSINDLTYERYRNTVEVRAVDYNLFAQDTFSDWVESMITLIRDLGSKQLIDVGQDEGGVTDRVLNQFYGGAGVSFTTNHTYWQDDALLWDSVVAKRPGVPNITGETGYQPVWAPDGTWRYDEFTGLGLNERKWALGFAAGATGAMQWDWAREVDFGMQRSDGSAKVWENQMRDLGEFARKAAPAATVLNLPEVALVLPQSYQLSVYNTLALEAQQKAVRALYGYARSEAYAVGEYQIELLGSPKLIILPSPFGLTQTAWQAIEEKVRAGAVLLVTGPFDEDAHMHATGRQDAVGVPFKTEPLTIRHEILSFPGGDEALSFSGNKTTALNQAMLPGGQDWIEKPLGRGKILLAALPLELNDNLRAVGDVYVYALKTAGVVPVYTTALKDPGILICPTVYPDATLYVLTSESDQTQVNFIDARSGRSFAGKLESGRAAILLIGIDGKLISSYHWSGE
jgi:Beta-galactosidase